MTKKEVKEVKRLYATITIDWDSIASIKRAEKQKLKLETRGYLLVSTINGFDKTELKYVKYSLK